ncbi:unnamed protein product [Rotaria sordida]|uniref:Uncharacterized protein n=1 Tax=Rotaria sordida TaxID=392033 RepID=A0A818ZUI3_9BILA|nr:unnamed protein product [Rotaria sordida]CAF3989908.1 unnamed protein product [Rotaria sordida]
MFTLTILSLFDLTSNSMILISSSLLVVESPPRTVPSQSSYFCIQLSSNLVDAYQSSIIMYNEDFNN